MNNVSERERRLAPHHSLESSRQLSAPLERYGDARSLCEFYRPKSGKTPAQPLDNPDERHQNDWRWSQTPFAPQEQRFISSLRLIAGWSQTPFAPQEQQGATAMNNVSERECRLAPHHSLESSRQLSAPLERYGDARSLCEFYRPKSGKTPAQPLDNPDERHQNDWRWSQTPFAPQEQRFISSLRLIAGWSQTPFAPLKSNREQQR